MAAVLAAASPALAVPARPLLLPAAAVAQGRRLPTGAAAFNTGADVVGADVAAGGWRSWNGLVCAAAAGAGAGVAGRQLRRRRRAAAEAPRRICALAATESKAASAAVELPDCRRVVEALFSGGGRSLFAPTALYESLDGMVDGQSKCWAKWESMPSRQIERICEGRTRCGCTWIQPDGTRGASFFRLSSEGQVSWVRECPEVPGMMKVKGNGMSLLKPLLDAWSAYRGALNFLPSYLTIEKSDEEVRPRKGLLQPTSRKAEDVVRFLYEEAVGEGLKESLDKMMDQFSENAVFEDMGLAEESWPRGKAAIRAYQEETMTSQPKGFKFVMDDVSEGIYSASCFWHAEAFGQILLRGLSFYELDDDGKVCYVRSCYDWRL